jgi:hypothetical protein
MSGLSLNEFVSEFGFHPWHFFQLADSTLVPVNSKCNTVVYQRAYLNADRQGRHDVALAIESAEQQIHRYAGFWPSPRFVEHTLQYPRLGDTRMARLWDVEGQGRWVSLTLPDAYIQAAGPALESAAVSAALTFTDEDGDGLYETATATGITVPANTDADEVVARFLTADCGPVTPQPEIQPRSISISGTTATLVFDTWTLVRPIATSGFNQTPLNPTVLPPTAGTPFAASVEVLTRRPNVSGTTTDTAMAVLVWETRPAPAWLPWCCDGAAGDPAATRQAIARVTLRDARAGIVALGEAVYDADSGTWHAACDWRCAPPDRVIIRYQAGVPLVDGRMAPEWRTAVARLAAAELTRPICACDGANKAIYDWQKDLSQTGATNDLYAAPDNISNPFGTRRGHVWAWNQIYRVQRLEGIYAG